MSTPDGTVQKPIILDGQEPVAPATPGSFSMREPSRTHAILRGSVAAFLVIGAMVNIAFGARFPGNAPVEQLFMIAIAILLFMGGVVLVIFAVLAGARRSVPLVPERTSPLSVAALVLVGVVFVAWLFFALLPTLGAIGGGDDARYMTQTGILVLFGAPWIVGLVFATLSLRSGGRRTALLAGIALALSLLLVVAAVVASVLYGVGLTA